MDFCHRSIREYFVAKGICRALQEDTETARSILTEMPVNHEVIYFAAELMKKKNLRVFEDNLIGLINLTRKTKKSKNLGGNAVTLLFQLKGELPGGDWSELNLDYADLCGANLSKKNFFGTSLRFTNLDSVNLEGADFRQCDLTGTRIEETAPVLALVVHPSSDRIIVAYGNGDIREWSIIQKQRRKSRTIGKNRNGTINWLGILTGSDLCAVTNEEIIFYNFENNDELLEISRFRKKSEYKQVTAKKNTLLLVSKEEQQSSNVLLVSLQKQRIINSVKQREILLCDNLDQKTFVLFEEKASLRIVRELGGQLKTMATFKVNEVKSLCTFCCKKDSRYLLGCGQRNGEILVWEINILRDKCQCDLLLKRHAHDGMVSVVAFLDDSRILSGGFDRRVSVLMFGTDVERIEGIQEQVLDSTIRCKGMKIDGVKGDREQEMLRRLISKAV